jgi:hypothetical protein
MKLWGWVVFGVVAAGCGHEQTTGNAYNGWSTPVGYGSVPPEAVRKLDPQLPPSMPKGSERQVYSEEQAPVQTLEAQAGVAPPAERGSALPPETVAPQQTAAPQETLPPCDATPQQPPSDLSP